MTIDACMQSDFQTTAIVQFQKWGKSNGDAKDERQASQAAEKKSLNQYQLSSSFRLILCVPFVRVMADKIN